jgi:tetratricopeptide (TPR) repeat protein
MRGWKIQACGLACLGALFFLVPHYSNAQAASPQAQQYYQAGTALYNQKNYSQAAKYYQAAFKISPNYAEAYQGIGSCWYAMGNIPYAKAYFNKALQLNPNNTRLAQFVQSMGGGQATAAATPAAGGDALAQGTALFQQKQYASAIVYFQQAIQQNPNDYRAYYYAGYSYYVTKDNKNAALYFELANQKQPNASIKAYGDRIKSGLVPDDQRWVEDQVAKLSQGGAVAQGTSEKKSSFGIHVLGGAGFLMPDPAQIIAAAQAAQTVKLDGITPDSIPYGGIEAFIPLGQNLEVGLGVGMSPAGNLTYTSVYGNATTFKYDYNTSILDVTLGGKYYFGDSKMRFYFGLGADICPTSINFTKTQLDASGAPDSTSDSNYKTGASVTGSYSTMAIGGHVQFGVDFSMGPGISVGPYLGYRYLNADSFKSGTDGLVINSDNSDVGPGASVLWAGGTNFAPLKLDYSTVMGGINLTFSF